MAVAVIRRGPGRARPRERSIARRRRRARSATTFSVSSVPVISNTLCGVGLGQTTARPSRARVCRRLGVQQQRDARGVDEAAVGEVHQQPPPALSYARRSESANTEAPDRSSSPVTAITLSLSSGVAEVEFDSCSHGFLAFPRGDRHAGARSGQGPDL